MSVDTPAGGLAVEVGDEAARRAGPGMAASGLLARPLGAFTAVKVTVRVAARGLPRLRRLVPVHGQDRVPVTATGEIEVTVPFENESWACAAILSLGASI